jgi:hypothetical protein
MGILSVNFFHGILPLAELLVWILDPIFGPAGFRTWGSLFGEWFFLFLLLQQDCVFKKFKMFFLIFKLF